MILLITYLYTDLLIETMAIAIKRVTSDVQPISTHFVHQHTQLSQNCYFSVESISGHYVSYTKLSINCIYYIAFQMCHITFISTTHTMHI